jgi:hypothetical protein
VHDASHKLCVVAAVLGLTLLPAAAAGQVDSPPASTQIKLITPFHEGHLGVGFAVTSQGSGKCFSESAASAGRPDAWRCSMGNAIVDPCFQNVMGDPKTLACPADPWSANVSMLTISEPLPGSARKDLMVRNAMPWAIELANGQHCTLFTGATAPIAGMRINYGCPGGYVAVGDIDRSQPVWRIFSQGGKSVALELTGITVAWY